MPRLLILGERGEQNPYHLLFCMLPQFKAFDNGVDKLYYKYPYSHPQPLRDRALAALPSRFQAIQDSSGFQIFVAPNEPVSGIGPTDTWVYSYVRELYSHLQALNQKKAIYISRRHAQTRQVLNEEELLDGLRSRGIQIVCLEHMTFEESILLFRQASFILGPHGAGFSFSAFSDPGSFLLEINDPGSSQSHFSTLAGECGLKYRRFTNLEKKDGNYIVDIASFFEAVDEVLSFLTYPQEEHLPQGLRQHDQDATRRPLALP
jgi:hypothetical protein